MTQWVKKLIVCGALALGTFAAVGVITPTASAQDRDRGYWDRNRMMREYRGAFYDSLQANLARAERDGYLRGDDFKRFNKAHHEVGEFQAKWSRGIFDPHDMDSAVASVQRVVDIPGLRPREREALRIDLNHMRAFRAHMEGRRY